MQKAYGGGDDERAQDEKGECQEGRKRQKKEAKTEVAEDSQKKAAVSGMSEHDRKRTAEAQTHDEDRKKAAKTNIQKSELGMPVRAEGTKMSEKRASDGGDEADLLCPLFTSSSLEDMMYSSDVERRTYSCFLWCYVQLLLYNKYRDIHLLYRDKSDRKKNGVLSSSSIFA